MEIPMNVSVLCEGKTVGRSLYVVINPITTEMTHFVVRDAEHPHVERMVPLSYVNGSSHDEIVLNCSRDRWRHLEPFENTEYIKVQVPHYEGSGFAWPYLTTSYKTVQVPVKNPRIPLHARDVHRGARVVAVDGQIGHVEEFIVDPESHHITHIVLAKGHLWGEKDIVIPMAAIKDFDEERVRLTIDRAAISKLPTVPVHRHVTAII